MKQIILIFTVLMSHPLFVLCLRLRTRFLVSSSKGPRSATRHYFKRPNDYLFTQSRRLTSDSKENNLCTNKPLPNKTLLEFDDVMSIIKEDNSEKLSDMIKQERVKVGMKKHSDSKARILTEACELRSLGCVKVLLNNWAGFDTYNSEGHDPFTNACIKSDIELIKLIIKESFMNNDPDIVDHWILESFSVADIIYNKEVTTLLLSYLTDINVFSNRDGDSLLHYTIKLNHIDMVQTLLDRGIDREAENDSGDTPLALAAKYEYIDIVKLLLSYNSSDDNTTTIPIYSILDTLNEIAQSRKKTEVIRILTDYITDMHVLTYALHIAVQAQHAGMTQILINRGVDVNAVYKGRTALSYTTTTNSYYWSSSPEGDPAVYPGMSVCI